MWNLSVNGICFIENKLLVMTFIRVWACVVFILSAFVANAFTAMGDSLGARKVACRIERTFNKEHKRNVTRNGKVEVLLRFDSVNRGIEIDSISGSRADFFIDFLKGYEEETGELSAIYDSKDSTSFY